MPFVSFSRLSPERIIHLSDQRKMAKQEWERSVQDEPSTLTEDMLNESQREALERLRSIERQLLGRPA